MYPQHTRWMSTQLCRCSRCRCHRQRYHNSSQHSESAWQSGRPRCRQRMRSLSIVRDRCSTGHCQHQCCRTSYRCTQNVQQSCLLLCRWRTRWLSKLHMRLRCSPGIHSPHHLLHRLCQSQLAQLKLSTIEPASLLHKPQSMSPSCPKTQRSPRGTRECCMSRTRSRRHSQDKLNRSRLGLKIPRTCVTSHLYRTWRSKIPSSPTIRHNQQGTPVCYMPATRLSRRSRYRLCHHSSQLSAQSTLETLCLLHMSQSTIPSSPTTQHSPQGRSQIHSCHHSRCRLGRRW